MIASIKSFLNMYSVGVLFVYTWSRFSWTMNDVTILKRGNKPQFVVIRWNFTVFVVILL